MVKNKYIFFDLDNTLCLVNKEIKSTTIKYLKRLSKENYIIICSGKSTYYLSGLFRQIEGLEHLILIGENGGNIQMGSILPPSEFYFPYKKKENIVEIKKIEKYLLDKFQDKVFLQPNLTLTTFYVFERNTIDLIKKELENIPFKEYDEFIDTLSIDLLPKGLNKGLAIRFLKDKYNLTSDDCIGLGDNFNDIKMFDECSLKISIGDTLPLEYTDLKFKTIDAAMKYLLHK